MGLTWILLLVGVTGTVLAIPALSRRMQRYRPDSTTARMASLGLGELDPLFNQGRLHEHKQREHEAVMPVRHDDSGRPRTRIDLEGGKASVHVREESA